MKILRRISTIRVALNTLSKSNVRIQRRINIPIEWCDHAKMEGGDFMDIYETDQEGVYVLRFVKADKDVLSHQTIEGGGQ